MRVLQQLDQEQRPATVDEQQVLSQWSSWGAVPDVFDERKSEWDAERATLKSLLSDQEYSQARRTVLNAHYTDPAYVAAIWKTLDGLGFTSGQALEPGSGVGTFIGMSPEGVQMTGVELDATTARISQALYPDATVRAESFADTNIPTGYFDAAVGNVPFADVKLHDRIDNANGHSLHNHFILKSLRLTRPGGLVAVLTSHYTLDAANPGARREMSSYGDLIGAVRLPGGAHRRTAGTEAVTDLLIFRRREPGTEPVADTTWEGVTPRVIDGVTTRVNSYFDVHPERVLGELTVANGMYGSDTLNVKARGPLDSVADQLSEALAGIVAEANERGLTMTPRTAAAVPAIALPDLDKWMGSIHATDAGTFEVSTTAGREPFKVPASAAKELRHRLALRDAASAQLATERATVDDTKEITTGRERLSALWHDYVATYGPINRFNATETSRLDEDGEPIITRRMPTATRLLRDDPFGPLVFALEVFDEANQQATPATLLERRVILPRAQKQGADTADEALQMSLDRNGRVDLDYIATMLGSSPEEAREQLRTIVFTDPETGLLEHAPAYLSGSLHPKLVAAREAAESDPQFQANVDALEQVMPAPLTPEEISARIGAVWISPAYHQQFLAEILRDKDVRVTNPLPGEWVVKAQLRRTVRATEEWGTERRPAPDLFQALASQSEIKVTDKIDTLDGEKHVFNPTETAAAQEKAQLLQERFEEWVWEDPTRAADLAAEYNRRFNSIVLRNYSDAGQQPSFPGIVESFTLRDHQKAAVARMLAEPAVGLFHEVGAGKTAEMVTGVMELKRLGLITKAAVVVPNHMLEQFSREWLQLYPQATILAANADNLAGDKRRMFVARAAANDWDAVIMTRTAFKRLNVEPENAATFINSQLDLMRTALENDGGDLDSRTLKQIEKRIAKEEEKLKKSLDVDRDPGLTFEATAIDYIVADEFHDFKNLATVSKIADASIAGSERAMDMALKIDYLRRAGGERVATVATATPIANSITEAHVMQRYLRPDLLRAAGVESFDAWAATFGEVVSDVEMAPQGGSNFRVKRRFSRFRNVPEMLSMWHVFADVKTAEDLNLPTPELRARADGKRIPETIALEPGEEALDYIRQLGDRADAVAAKLVLPTEDNMLKISTDGRKVALDIRMVDPTATPLTVPLNSVADNIARIHREHADDEFLDTRTGEPSPTRGALQIVFCDLGTPSDKWNAYDELKEKLIARGVPANGIRYVHEAKNDKDKARLFSAAREGGVSVLIGSTAKMGVGTNVQARAIALHDVDCPWRPADVQQRHGRIMRQGNQNAEVGIYQYVTSGSFAAYMWQAIERKSRFIGQIMRGRLDVREIHDVGSDSLSAAEAKALASGNPLLLERSVALNEVGRLERLERAFHRSQRTLALTVQEGTARIDKLQADTTALTHASGRVKDLSGDRFNMTVNGTYYATRAEAAVALARWAGRAGIQYARPRLDDRPRGILGEISGFPIAARTVTDLGKVYVRLELDGIPGMSVTVDQQKALDEHDIGTVRMLEHRLNSVPDLIRRNTTEVERVEGEVADANANRTNTFKYAGELTQARDTLARVDTALEEMAAPKPEQTPPAAEAPATTAPVRQRPDMSYQPPSIAPASRLKLR